MTESPCCPKCGIQLPADAPAGLCPKCLVQAGFESQHLSASGEPGPTKLTPPASGFVPPTVEELAPLFPQLEILELLGKGGMGAVYKARQPGLDRLVAVKILPPEISHDPSFAERFQREARALARLSHPHIVTVYDFGVARPESSRGVGQIANSQATPFDDSGRATQGSLCYIVMEFVDGANLRQAIQTKKLTPAEALAIVPQICEALQFAHDEGIVHRDIKPENILIDKRGRVKIADFGLVKLLGTDGSDHSLTATHQVMGTLRYMAPEQMQGSREVDHRADIYSLGVVFYELLTGELPMGRFAPPSKRVQVDVRLDEVVLRALEQDPEQRYQHASDVKTDVDTINRTRSSGREAPPSAGDESASNAALQPITLLDESMSVWKRWLPVVPSLAALTVFVIAIPLALTDHDPMPWLWTGLGLALLGVTLGLTVKVEWDVEYRGHRIRFEYIVLRYKRLMIDGWTAASGGIGWFYELRTTIKEGQGIGDEILCTVEASWIFRCRIIAVPKTPIAPAVESLPSPEPAKAQSWPRFSRFAIAGAVWALFGLLAIIPTLYFIGLNRVWNGTALPTDVIHSEPPLVFSIFMGALLVIGSGAPIGTTIYGAVAIGRIKRSGGTIIGLPLAVADVLFFPLLVLSGVIAALVAQVGYSMAPHPNAAAVTSAGAIGVLVALVVCFFVARAVWRAIVRNDKPIDQRSPASLGENSGEPGCVSARTSDEQVRWLTPAGSPSVQVGRPRLIPVLATFNLIGAIVLMLVCAMEQPPTFAPSGSNLWQVWEVVDSVLGFTMAAGMFAASIGLFLWKPWARKLTLGVCVFGLASFVFDAPYLARYAIPNFYAEVQQTITEEGVTPDVRDFTAMITVVVLIGGTLVVVLTGLIGQLVYFTRSRVVAAFASSNEKPNRFVEWLFTGAGTVVGVLSVFGPVALLLGIASLMNRSDTSSRPLELPPPPSFGTITGGIGAEFRVPIGQVAVFEIVTRRDGQTVPVPPHCGYVIAPSDRRLAATFRWLKAAEQPAASDKYESWNLEIKTAGGGGGFSGGLMLPKDLSQSAGGMGIHMGDLAPNEEVIQWFGNANDLPDNGLLGLRVTVTPHGLETSGGSGCAHTDWKKAMTDTSISRRKLPVE